MKKLLLAWFMFVLLTSVSAQTTFTSNGINYRTTSVNTVEVTASGPYYTEYTGSITLPKTVMNSGVTYAVTSIGEAAFNGCRGLTSISIPSSLASIGKGAFFECTGLTSITIPSSVTSIGGSAFQDCSSLTSITIPSSVTAIGDGAFWGCSAVKKYTVHPRNPTYSSLDDVLFNKDRTTLIAYPNRESSQYVIPSSVTRIGIWAFSHCTSLTSITIPSSVTSIGDGAFEFCSSLSSLTIPSSVTSIERGAFLVCTSLTSITIPSSVTSIGYDAFNGCISLTSLTIPSSVTSIGYLAFGGCSSLTSITIPSSVTTIGYGAFFGCTAVKKYTVDTGNPNYSTFDDVLFDKNRTTLIAYSIRESSQYVIPSSVTSIGDGAFSKFTGLTSITIPSSVTSIGNQAFDGCISLTSPTIPSSVTSIGDGAFWGCTAVKKFAVDPSNPTYSSLDDVLFNKDKTTLIAYPNRESSQYVIPSSVTTIGRWAFRYCTSLTSITISSSVTAIGDQAFDGCTELSEIHCQKEVPLPIMSRTFNSVGKATCKLYVPKGSSVSYSKAPYWMEFQTIIEEDSKAL